MTGAGWSVAISEVSVAISWGTCVATSVGKTVVAVGVAKGGAVAGPQAAKNSIAKVIKGRINFLIPVDLFFIALLSFLIK
jgi:hypothetical protein